MFATADYLTKAHNIYVMASYYPTEKLKTVGTVVYNKSTGAYDPVDMPDVEPLLDGNLDHMDYNFDEMHQYSELDYAMYQLSLGFEYRVSDTWWVSLNGDYAKLDDKKGYVYGTETGSYYMVRTGARVTF